MGLLDAIADLDAQEDEQLAEDPDACVDLDMPSGMAEFADYEVRAATREHLEDTIAHSRGRWLCDQALDSRDRPGKEPVWQDAAHELDTAEVLKLSDGGPGHLLVPPPPLRSRQPGEQGWLWHVERALWRQLTPNHMTAVRFSGPVALDIAFRGGCADHADIDNLAGKVVAAFSQVLQHPPNVAGYRAYRLDGEPVVRVRVMPATRLRVLADAMERGRTLVRSERSERLRTADVP
jgi:hypothetical protein